LLKDIVKVTLLVQFILKQNAELAVKDMLREIAKQTELRTGTTTLHAVDYMDNGAPIKLTVDIDAAKVRNLSA
jgi:5-oxoprolinase (ATP-hydrolysing)